MDKKNYDIYKNAMKNMLGIDVDEKIIQKEELSISQDILEKLLPYQHDHFKKLAKILKNNNSAIDSSDAGIGKTYISIGLAKLLNLNVIFICNKSIISYVYEICKLFEVNLLALVNYEMIKKGKMYTFDSEGNLKKVKCPYITIRDNNIIWNNTMLYNTMFIFDEAHNCKSHKTQSGKLLLNTIDVINDINNNSKLLMISATLCNNIDEFKVYGYMLGYYKKLKDFNKFKKEYVDIKDLNLLLYKNDNAKGSRISFADISKNIEYKNKIISKSYNISRNIVNNIDKLYNKINKNINIIENKAYNSLEDIKIEILKARQKIELLKIEIIIYLIDKHKNDCSIAVFVNFKKTIELLKEHYDTNCIIDGSVSSENRDKNIKNFKSGKETLILCNIKSGGVSINLHNTEIEGKTFISIIFPSFSLTELVQTLGRIYRSGIKGNVIQYIPFTTSILEEKICVNINEKLTFLNNLNSEIKLKKYLKTNDLSLDTSKLGN